MWGEIGAQPAEGKCPRARAGLTRPEEPRAVTVSLAFLLCLQVPQGQRDRKSGEDRGGKNSLLPVQIRDFSFDQVAFLSDRRVDLCYGECFGYFCISQ